MKTYTLRVRANGEIGRLLNALDSGNFLTATELQGIGGLRRSARLLPRLMKWFDNLNVQVHENGTGEKSYGMKYFPVREDVQRVVLEKSVVAETTVSNTKSEIQPIMWQDVPPFCQKMENFRVPSWYSTMRTMVDLGKHISLEGAPGTGKDTAVIQLASESHMPLVTIGGDAGFRRRDLVGTTQISNGQSWFEAAGYATAAVKGWWVLLTEVNAADADALMYINAQLAAPYIITVDGKTYPVHKDFRLFITYNAGLVGTKPLPQSFKDRFFPIKIPFYTESELRKVLTAHGLPENVAGDEIISYPWTYAIVKFGMQMWDAYERGQIRYQITTRRLIDAIALMNCGESDVKSALKQAVISAIDSPVESKVADTILKTLQF